MIVFQGNPGRLVVLTDPTVPGFTRSMATPTPGITVQGQRSIITRVAVAQQTNAQFLHTLGSDIYIYVFGDRIGQLVISGLSFAADCDGGGDAHGMELMMQYYTENKLSARRDPVKVMIGRVPVTGFVQGLTTDIVDPSTRIAQYNLTLMMIPDKPPASASSRFSGDNAAENATLA
jgi:hypothetical protein